MREEKLKSDMNIGNMVSVMCEGNPGAAAVLGQMASDFRTFMDIFLCDSLGIRGSKLYMLNNDCCGRNIDKFKRTLMMLRCGVFTDEEIHTNLELGRAIPFIDDSIAIDGVPSYNEEFGPGDEKWEEFCKLNKEAFTKKLAAALEKQNKQQYK